VGGGVWGGLVGAIGAEGEEWEMTPPARERRLDWAPSVSGTQREKNGREGRKGRKEMESTIDRRRSGKKRKNGKRILRQGHICAWVEMNRWSH